VQRGVHVVAGRIENTRGVKLAVDDTNAGL
jgi:hypothetical protein